MEPLVIEGTKPYFLPTDSEAFKALIDSWKTIRVAGHSVEMVPVPMVIETRGLIQEALDAGKKLSDASLTACYKDYAPRALDLWVAGKPVVEAYRECVRNAANER